MKKKLFPVAIGILSIFSMISCESEKPENGGGTEPVTELNQYIYKDLMVDNYLWEVPTSPNLYQDPVALFNSLLNKDDKVSSIRDVNNLPTSLNDPGFEYAANEYQDGKTYYVIYYVKNGTSAATSGLKRGYLIKSVNGTDVTKENSATLLSNAAKSNMVITAFRPTNSANYFDFQITPPASNYAENPLYIATDTVMGDKKVGYIMYNRFNAEANYDNELANKLQEYMSKGINYLVLDLRYNAGGSLNSATALGSALVKNRNTAETFVLSKYRADLNKDYNYKLIDNTAGGTAISRLGNSLNRIYVITGQYSAGTTQAFINSLKAYWGNDVVVVGEKVSDKYNGSNNLQIAGKIKDNWYMQIPICFMADKNTNYDYANGFSPSIAVKEVNQTYNLMLFPLGSTGETVYKAIINSINGTTRSASADDMSASSSIVMSSIEDKLITNALEQ